MNTERITEFKERARLAWAILRGKDDTLVAHAKRELAQGLGERSDSMDYAMAVHLVGMVRVFSAEGHSGFSASYAVAALKNLLGFEPLGPLTGGDDEWAVLDFDEHVAAQNKRCSHVFRRADGTAYDSEAVVFREPSGLCFVGKHSRRDITFPYTPQHVYADVPENADDCTKGSAAQMAWEGRYKA